MHQNNVQCDADMAVTVAAQEEQDPWDDAELLEVT